MQQATQNPIQSNEVCHNSKPKRQKNSPKGVNEKPFQHQFEADTIPN